MRALIGRIEPSFGLEPPVHVAVPAVRFMGH